MPAAGDDARLAGSRQNPSHAHARAVGRRAYFSRSVRPGSQSPAPSALCALRFALCA